MPFDLTSLPVEQCLHFASRLAAQLHLPKSRSCSMAVREAFARAAGYPNAHAVEAAAKHAGAAGGTKAPTHPILDWARRAWKQQRALLEVEPFGATETQALLATVWGYGAWEAVTAAVELHLSHPELPWLRGDVVERAALFMGRNEHGKLWMPRESWEHHVLLFDGDTRRRLDTILDWAAQRQEQGDRVLILDGGGHDRVFASMLGHETNVMDWRETISGLPGITDWPLEILVSFLTAGLLPNSSFGETQEFTRARATQTNTLIEQALSISQRFLSLASPLRNLRTLNEMVMAHENLDSGFRKTWERGLGMAGEWREAQAAIENQASATLVRLPKLQAEEPGRAALQRTAMAASWVKANIQARMTAQPDMQRLAIFWLDVPLWARPAGWATVYAQARGLGVSLVEAFSDYPAAAKLEGVDSDASTEALASIGNLNTKVFGAAEAAKREWLARSTTRILNIGQHHVRRGGDAMAAIYKSSMVTYLAGQRPTPAGS